MASLKSIRNRIQSVRATRRITRAMKMVAAAKFRRARLRVEAARPYGEALRSTFARLLDHVSPQEIPEFLRLDPAQAERLPALFVILSSDRGMCGAMNGNVAREARRLIKERQAQGRQSLILPVGRKAIVSFTRSAPASVVGKIDTMGQPIPSMERTEETWQLIKALLVSGKVGAVYLVYPHFVSAMMQQPRVITLVEQTSLMAREQLKQGVADAGKSSKDSWRYIFEPDADTLLPGFIDEIEHMSIFLAMLETSSSEQGARMTAMDGATRNASDLLDRLVLNYNRTRQANITRELNEIVSGAAAVG